MPQALSLPLVPLSPGELLAALWWPVLAAVGVILIMRTLPFGKPLPDLGARLRRLDVDERMRQRGADPEECASWVPRALGRWGVTLNGGLGRLGLDAGPDVVRKLRAARPQVTVGRFQIERAALALAGACALPLGTLLGVAPLGPWPVWAWVLGAIAGWIAPVWDLERRLARRRTRCVVELPQALDLMVIAASAGLGLEQALGVVADDGPPLLAGEVRRALLEMALVRSGFVEALEAMAERNAIPELTLLVSQLRASSEGGLPLIATFTAQAERMRALKRIRIIEAGQRATVLMLLPVALLIFPTLFCVLLYPAVVQFLGIGI